jgi:hypothetical protein
MLTNSRQLTEFSNRITHFKNLLKGQFMLALIIQKNVADSLIKVIDSEYCK